MNKNSLTDERIGVLIDSKIQDAISWYSSRLSKERATVMDYYDRNLPKPDHAGGCTWVSPHVYKGVEQMKAQLCDTFSAGSGMVTFNARNAADVEAARIASDYANYVLFEQNDGDAIIEDAIFDGLTARVGIAKAWWEPEIDEIEKPCSNVSEDELEAWSQSDNIFFDVEIQPDGSYAGTVLERRDVGQVRIESINPEDFAIERNAKELSDKYFCVHRSVMTVDDLIRLHPDLEGREEDLVSGQDDDGAASAERLTRFREVSDGMRQRGDEVQDELREVTVYEAYCRFKRKGDLSARLYRVKRCGTVTVEIMPVTKLPFAVYAPLRHTGRFYGTNYAKTIIPTQNLHTMMFRAQADHAALTTNPRWFVPQGSLSNPKEFLANRRGGIIEYTQGQKPEAMQQPQLSPLLGNLMQGLDQMNEEITGISAASVGLNKDVLSSQNSTALYEQFTGNGQTRQKHIARNFAKMFLIPLYELIYDLVVQFESNEKQFKVAGNFVAVNPGDWEEGRTASASLHLGFGEKESHAREIIEFAKVLKDSDGDAFTGYEGFYNMLSDAMTLKGRRADIPRYLPITPDRIQPKQPSPKEIAEVEVLQANAYLAKSQADAAMKKVDVYAELTHMKQKFNEIESMIGHRENNRDQNRKDAETKNRIDIAQREMNLLENPPTDTESRGIISP